MEAKEGGIHLESAQEASLFWELLLHPLSLQEAPSCRLITAGAAALEAALRARTSIATKVSTRIACFARTTKTLAKMNSLAPLLSMQNSRIQITSFGERALSLVSFSSLFQRICGCHTRTLTASDCGPRLRPSTTVVAR
jgi:hypothetical protein